MSSRRIDVLSTIGAASCFPFVVNNTVPAVQCGLGSGLLRSFHSVYYFGKLQAGDNTELLSFGLSIPAPYCLAHGLDGSTMASMTIDGRNGGYGANWTPVFMVPYGNYEMSIGQFNPALSGQITQNLDLYVNFGGNNVAADTPWISMLNVPDSENGKTYYLSVFIKINHTLALV